MACAPGTSWMTRRCNGCKEAAGVSNVKATAADLMGKRAMSRRDLERKLQDKGASEAEARYAAEWLEAIGAINDADYAAVLARHCADLGYGPQRVREKLYEKGVPRELWDDALDALPDSAGADRRASWSASSGGGCLDQREKKRLCDALLRRGFSWAGGQGGTEPPGQRNRGLRAGNACKIRSCLEEMTLSYTVSVYFPWLCQESGELRTDDGHRARRLGTPSRRRRRGPTWWW